MTRTSINHTAFPGGLHFDARRRPQRRVATECRRAAIWFVGEGGLNRRLRLIRFEAFIIRSRAGHARHE